MLFTLKGLKEHLKAHGLFITDKKIYYALSMERLPEPDRLSDGHRCWTKDGADQVLDYFMDKSEE